MATRIPASTVARTCSRRPGASGRGGFLPEGRPVPVPVEPDPVETRTRPGPDPVGPGPLVPDGLVSARGRAGPGRGGAAGGGVGCGRRLGTWVRRRFGAARRLIVQGSTPGSRTRGLGPRWVVAPAYRDRPMIPAGQAEPTAQLETQSLGGVEEAVRPTECRRARWVGVAGRRPPQLPLHLVDPRRELGRPARRRDVGVCPAGPREADRVVGQARQEGEDKAGVGEGGQMPRIPPADPGRSDRSGRRDPRHASSPTGR